MSNSPEQGNTPSLYNELFVGFAGMAAVRGVIQYGPLDPSLSPGKDGTRTPIGGKAYGYDYIVKGDELPSAVQDMGIDKLEIGRYSATIMDDDIWPERVWVYLHETAGLTRGFTFSKEHGATDIEARVRIDADDPLTPESKRLMPDVDTVQRIIDGLMSGEAHWLELDGPEGEFARFFHVNMTAPDELSIEDVDQLNKIYNALKG